MTAIEFEVDEQPDGVQVASIFYSTPDEVYYQPDVFLARVRQQIEDTAAHARTVRASGDIVVETEVRHDFPSAKVGIRVSAAIRGPQ